MISGRAMIDVHRYWDKENPVALAITTDGAVGGFSSCRDVFCREEANDVALSACRRMARGRTCKVLAEGRRIVWKGPVSFADHFLLEGYPESRIVIVYWDHRTKRAYRQRAYGKVRLSTAAQQYISFQESRALGRCSGVIANFPNGDGRFRVQCDKTGAVSGDLRTENTATGRMAGTAFDVSKNNVEVVILGRHPELKRLIKKTE